MGTACRRSSARLRPVTHSRIAESRNRGRPTMKSVMIDRRTCLKGLGASLALPLLEVMGSTAQGKTYKPPVRLGFMYMPHGVIMDQFWPADAASFLSSPPPALESLRP